MSGNVLRKSKTLDIETQVVLSCINRTISHSNALYLENVDWKRVLYRASVNRVLYFFAKSLLNTSDVVHLLPPQLLQTLKLVVEQGAIYLGKLEKTVELLASCLSDASINFMVFKTFKDIPYVTLDVDVLVSDFCVAREILRSVKEEVRKREGFENKGHAKLYAVLGTHLPKILDIHFQRFPRSEVAEHIALPKDFLTVDLHGDLLWRGAKYVDLDLVWRKPRTWNIDGVKCLIPNLDVEVLLELAHILRERSQITLHDFLFVKNRSQKVNWNLVLEQARKYEWYRSALLLLSTINELNRKLYSQEEEPLIRVEGAESITPKCAIKGQLAMPYMLRPFHEINIIRERMKKELCLPVFGLLYYMFAFIRYEYTNGLRVPIYDHWFDFKMAEESARTK